MQDKDRLGRYKSKPLHANPHLAKLGCSNSFTERFWKKVKKLDGCWLWVAYKNKFGYGQIRTPRVVIPAHVASWVIHKGSIPTGRFVCHDCPGGDNPACVNPAHLFLGDHVANAADMARKGRSVRGEKSHFCKLTDVDVMTIREMWQTRTASQRALARRFGVHVTYIFKLVHHTQRWLP